MLTDFLFAAFGDNAATIFDALFNIFELIGACLSGPKLNSFWTAIEALFS